jgi:glutamate/aspartate transport system permease protein
MHYTFNWSFFFKSIGGKETYLTWLVTAWEWTLTISFFGFLVAFILGAIVGIFRTTNNKYLVTFGNIWTEIFRNIPLLVQIFLWYHVIPHFIPIINKAPRIVLVVMAIGLFTSSRVSENFKSGIQSLSIAQKHAGLALGLNTLQLYWYALLPQAIRIIIPTLTSEAMNIIKNSSVAFAISIAELTMFAMQAQEETARGIEIYLVVSVLYFISAFAVNLISQFIEHKIKIPNQTFVKQ